MKIHPQLAILGIGYWDIVPLERLREPVDTKVITDVMQHADRVKADFLALPKPPRPWDRRTEPGRSKFL